MLGLSKLERAKTLDDVEHEMERKFDVDWVGFDALTGEHDYLVLDTRSREEFETSHIDGAVQVDPNISPEAFQTDFGDSVNGKKLVAYCSVGYRSSVFVSTVAEVAKAQGATSIASLRGGIFRWSSEELPLMNSAGATTDVHGYDSFWSKFLNG